MNAQNTQETTKPAQEEKFVALCKKVAAVLQDKGITRADGTLICLIVAAMLSAPEGFDGTEDLPEPFEAMVPVYILGGPRALHFSIKAAATAIRSLQHRKEVTDNAENN